MPLKQPFRGLVNYAAVLCFLFEEREAVYFALRSMFARYWCKLNALRSGSGMLLRLLRLFEVRGGCLLAVFVAPQTALPTTEMTLHYCQVICPRNEGSVVIGWMKCSSAHTSHISMLCSVAASRCVAFSSLYGAPDITHQFPFFLVSAGCPSRGGFTLPEPCDF